MDGREVSKNIVSTYIVDDAVLTQRASSSEIADIESGSTLSAIERALVPNVISTMNQFISTIAAVDQTWVAQAREYTPGYNSIFGEAVPSPFIVHGNFAD